MLLQVVNYHIISQCICIFIAYSDRLELICYGTKHTVAVVWHVMCCKAFLSGQYLQCMCLRQLQHHCCQQGSYWVYTLIIVVYTWHCIRQIATIRLTINSNIVGTVIIILYIRPWVIRFTTYISACFTNPTKMSASFVRDSSNQLFRRHIIIHVANGHCYVSLNFRAISSSWLWRQPGKYYAY